jgi:dTDP-4-amino-4,6-dideoxygalactose transaminase
MLGIGAGDEVITTAHTWISTAEMITQTGARCIFADIDPEYYTVDPEAVRKKITGKTKAVIAVHIYGQMADVEALAALCDQHNIYLIEDCAQSHLSKLGDRLAGEFGIAASFSFYPGKNLGAYGDAGAIITRDTELADKCRMYANHGALIRHQHYMEGINSRLDGLQAAILNVKLKHLPAWNNQRIQAARKYDALLSGISQIKIPSVRPGGVHTYHLYVIQCEARGSLAAYLTDCGIQTGIHYPTALPFLPAYRYLRHRNGDFVQTEALYSRILSLPMFPEITDQQIEYISDSIIRFYKK